MAEKDRGGQNQLAAGHMELADGHPFGLVDLLACPNRVIQFEC
ncbi:MAG: hypothetical protein WDN46_04880 [Methylocella sp.]